MRILSFILFFFVSTLSYAEKHPADKIFNAYAEKDGFTTVNIGANFLQFIKMDKANNKDMDNFTGIKILAAEGDTNKQVDFRKDIIAKLDRDKYKELMVVKEKNQEVLMLVLENNEKISEFLMVVGGEDNTLISIRGDFYLDSLRNLGKTAAIAQLEHLDKIETGK